MDKRSRARELAVQALYQLDIQGEDLISRLGRFFMENEPDLGIQKLASNWCRGTWENMDICDKLITDSTIKWELSRLSFVDKSILRLSVYQLKFCPEVPPKVVINEAIEIAKKFSGKKAPAFINGVLDAVLKKLTDCQSNQKSKL